MNPRTFLLILVCLGASTQARSAPGELDSSFGANGFARVNVPYDSNLAAGAYAQTDGRLLVGRENDLEEDNFSVLRFNADGTPDLSFGAGGRTSHSRDVWRHGRTFTILQQSDGGVIAAGTLLVDRISSTETLALARYLPDGRVDTGFGAAGIASVDFSGADNAFASANAVVQQADGKLVAAGSVIYNGWWDYSFWPPEMTLARFDTAGALDTGFGTAGVVVLNPDPTPSRTGELRWLTQQPDGKLVAAGSAGPDSAVIRLSADGVLDSTFGPGGIVLLSAGPAGSTSAAEAVAVQADGKIVIGGTIRSSCDLDDAACEAVVDAFLARFNSDGSADTSFGAAGVVTFDAGADETEVSAGGLIVEPAGTLIVGGDTHSPGGPRDGFLARFTVNGELDSSFGDRGRTLIDAGETENASNAYMHGMTRFADGRVAVAMTNPSASVDTTLVTARLSPAGGNAGMIGLTHTTLTVDEGATAEFVVRRTGGSAGIVGVDYTTTLAPENSADPADFVATAGTLVWPDGDTATHTIAVPIVADGLVELREDFMLVLSNAAGGASLAASRAEVQITDVNEHAGVLQFEDDSLTIEEGPICDAALSVSRNGGATGLVAVSYATAEGTATEGQDYFGQNGTLQWRDGDTASKAICLGAYGDTEIEDTETFRVILSAPSGGATLGYPASATVTILDPNTATDSANGGGDRGGGGSSGLLEIALLCLLVANRMPRPGFRRS